MRYLVTRDDLERRAFGVGGSVTHRFHGGRHGLDTVSLMLGDVQPGDGPLRHIAVHGTGEIAIEWLDGSDT